MSLPTPDDLPKDIRVRTHTFQYQLATPVPASTPPEHQPNSDASPDAWNHLDGRTPGPTEVPAAARGAADGQPRRPITGE